MNISQILKKHIWRRASFRKNRDSSYCYFLDEKLYHGYFSANMTKFLKQLPLSHLKKHILSVSKSKTHVKLGNIFFWKLRVFKINVFFLITI